MRNTVALDRDTVRGAAGWERGGLVALLVGRAALDRDTVRGAAGWERGGLVALLVGRAARDRDTVREAAGKERGGWDGWEPGGGTGGKSGAG